MNKLDGSLTDTKIITDMIRAVERVRSFTQYDSDQLERFHAQACARLLLLAKSWKITAPVKESTTYIYIYIYMHASRGVSQETACR